jgi:16S rRNA U1498 N3-methylase RsmE
LEVEMSTSDERDAERKRSAEKALRREATVKRIKDIVWTAVIASLITIIVVTALGWLTTQTVVEKAREEGAEDLVALRASICLVRFQQRPDAEAKLAEFKALSWTARDDAVRKFVTEEGLATMLGEDAPAPGAVDKCVDAIKGS